MVKFKDWPSWPGKLPENSQPFISHSCWPQCLPAFHIYPDCSLAVQAMPCISSIRAVDTKLNRVHNFSFTLLLSACVEFLAWKRNQKGPVRWGHCLQGPDCSSPWPRETQTICISFSAHTLFTYSETSYSPWHGVLGTQTHGKRTDCKTSLSA